MTSESPIETFAERLAAAAISAIAAAVTLVLYPIALALLGRGMGGGAEFELGAFLYATILSKVGLVIVVAAAAAGFCLGSERMANVFSFFWGTHSCWARLGAYLDDKSAELQSEYNVSLWLLLALLLTLIGIVVFKYA